VRRWMEDAFLLSIVARSATATAATAIHAKPTFRSDHSKG